MKYQNRVMRFDSLPELLEHDKQRQFEDTPSREEVLEVIANMNKGHFTRPQVWFMTLLFIAFLTFTYAYFPDVMAGGGQ